MSGNILEVRSLATSFATARGPVLAVRDVSFDIGVGEIVGLVGESGSGKTATAQSVMQLLPSHATVTGSIQFGGRDLAALDRQQLRGVRGREISMIFQDPMTSLNPVLTIGTQFLDVLRAHGTVTRAAARSRGVELLGLVGIPEPALRMQQYPHQMSGGMRQRALIALALANEPRLLIADEPTTALDVTVQAGILRLLVELRDRIGMSILLVTHDLGVVSETCDRVLVMYGGRLVEAGIVRSVLRAPRHPYTAALLSSSIPVDVARSERLVTIDSSADDLHNPFVGCAFNPPCSAEEHTHD